MSSNFDDEDNGGFGVVWNASVPVWKTKCECGIEKVYGKAAQESYHSDWCPIGRARESRIKEQKEAERLIEELVNAKNS